MIVRSPGNAFSVRRAAKRSTSQVGRLGLGASSNLEELEGVAVGLVDRVWPRVPGTGLVALPVRLVAAGYKVPLISNERRNMVSDFKCRVWFNGTLRTGVLQPQLAAEHTARSSAACQCWFDPNKKDGPSSWSAALARRCCSTLKQIWPLRNECS